MLKDNFEFRFCIFNNINGYVAEADKDGIKGGFAPELANEILKVFEKYGITRAYGELNFNNNFLKIHNSNFEGDSEDMKGITCSFVGSEIYPKND